MCLASSAAHSQALLQCVQLQARRRLRAINKNQIENKMTWQLGFDFPKYFLDEKWLFSPFSLSLSLSLFFNYSLFLTGWSLHKEWRYLHWHLFRIQPPKHSKSRTVDFSLIRKKKQTRVEMMGFGFRFPCCGKQINKTNLFLEWKIKFPFWPQLLIKQAKRRMLHPGTLSIPPSP